MRRTLSNAMQIDLYNVYADVFDHYPPCLALPSTTSSLL